MTTYLGLICYGIDRPDGNVRHAVRCTVGRMGIWGWALLVTRPRLVEWHKVVMTQELERPAWARYLTACRLRIEAPLADAEARPGDGPVCNVCLSTND
jgi:hypothetical protein